MLLFLLCILRFYVYVLSRMFLFILRQFYSCTQCILSSPSAAPFSLGTLNNPLPYVHMYTYDFISNFFLYVYVSVSCAFVLYACSCCLQNSKRRYQIPWSWNFRWLWAAQHGDKETSLGPRENQLAASPAPALFVCLSIANEFP